MNLTRAYTECAASKTELVVCGGCKATDSRNNVKNVEAYNPETDKYVNLPPTGFILTDPEYNYSTFHSLEPYSTISGFPDTDRLKVQDLKSPLSFQFCH